MRPATIRFGGILVGCICILRRVGGLFHFCTGRDAVTPIKEAHKQPRIATHVVAHAQGYLVCAASARVSATVKRARKVIY